LLCPTDATDYEVGSLSSTLACFPPPPQRRGKCTRFWWESPKERDHTEDRGIDGRMGSEWILGEVGGGVDSVDSGQEPVEAVVNTVTNLRGCIKWRGVHCLTGRLSAYVELVIFSSFVIEEY
jgi:hypothetical protein